MKWYKQRYVNRRDWLIENYENFNFRPEEGMLILAIDYLNTHNIETTYEMLSKKTNLSKDDIDDVLSALIAKNFINVYTDKGLVFDISNIFETDVKERMLTKKNSILEIFVEQFGRPLNINEREKLADLLKEFDEKELKSALKRAIIYKKVSFPYIETVLRNNSEKNENSLR